MNKEYIKPTILHHQKVTFETLISNNKRCVIWFHVDLGPGQRQVCGEWVQDPWYIP